MEDNTLISDLELKKLVLKKLAELNHDLRSPFATLQSFLNIIEMEDYTMPAEDMKEITQSLRLSMEKSIETIDSKLMELTRMLQ